MSIPFPPFWELYGALPKDIQRLADKQFDLFLTNPHHPSLGFKKKGEVLHRRSRAILPGRRTEARGYLFLVLDWVP